MSQLLETAVMKLVIYGKWILVLKCEFSFQLNAILFQSLLGQELDQSLSIWLRRRFTLHTVLCWLPFPTLFQEVHFSFWINAHHPLSLPLQEIIFHPEMQFCTCMDCLPVFNSALIYLLLHTAMVIASTNHCLASFPHW